MLRDIVKQCVMSQVDVEVVGELFAGDWTERLRMLKPEVVIISLRPGESDVIATRLLEIVPSAKIVALSPDNRRALFCTMRAHRLLLSDFSAEEVAALISRGH
jgi:DNA-binding NarL/FixJ family response regulator